MKSENKDKDTAPKDDSTDSYPADASKYYCACDLNCGCGNTVDQPGELCSPCAFH